MKTNPTPHALALLGWMAGTTALAQAYVTPTLGGGQVAANMVHIDLFYDADANQLQAHVDDTYGVPELRPLEPGQAFDPQQKYAVLNGKAYNAQYGWNVGGFFTMPPGAAIWIELTHGSPGLETYAGSGRLASYTPIFGTGGSPLRWKWSGVMVHNTYAVTSSTSAQLVADYHLYFGDANTGSRDGFMHLDDTTVRLQWTIVPVEDPLTFRFGAVAQTNRAPLSFLNASEFITETGFVVNLRGAGGDSNAFPFEGVIPMLAVPATVPHGGPAPNHAAPGSCLEVQFISLAGPPGGSLGCWEAAGSQARFTMPIDETAGTNRLRVSESEGAPGGDPYGCIQGRRLAVNRPGLYCLGFKVVDTSTNGPGGASIHAPSDLYCVYLQAGSTIAAVRKEGPSVTAVFGGEPGKTFYLERARTLGPSTEWETVAGPLAGTNRLQTLADPTATGMQAYFRLRAEAR